VDTGPGREVSGPIVTVRMWTHCLTAVGPTARPISVIQKGSVPVNCTAQVHRTLHGALFSHKHSILVSAVEEDTPQSQCCNGSRLQLHQFLQNC
jgi:hypothetical protein